MALLGLNGSSLNFAKGLGGFILMQQGTALAARGARSAGAAALATSQYNASLVSFNLNRELDFAARQLNKNISSQRAAAGGSGLKVTSKSFLEVTDATMHQFERELTQRRNSAQIERQGILFEGAQRQAASERQAQGIEARGRIDAINALPSLLSQAQGLF